MLDNTLQSKLVDLSKLLIDQQRAKVTVPPNSPSSGYWFGGGNMVNGDDGDLYVVGRYRNAGDSRTGVAAGTRGLELAIFRSQDRGSSFDKIVSLSKQDLGSSEQPVLSIEGCALEITADGIVLYVSTEKDGVGYPAGFQNFLKPGTGVWSIDRIKARSFEDLQSAEIESLVVSQEPATIHVKDPFLYQSDRGAMLFFCSHPFSWTCSNTGYVKLEDRSAVYEFFPRGYVWDVAITRGTCIVDVPRIGAFSDLKAQLMFYDGGECVRDYPQHNKSVSRPRGYSCEELGGVAYVVDEKWHQPQRLSRYEPMFVSPFGTGCSRYVDVLTRPEGMYATWQQSQEDGSQPLVSHFVPQSEIEAVLS